MKNFIMFNKLFEEFKFQKKFNLTESFGNSPENFISNITVGLESAKVFNISNSIKKLLVLTTVPKINDKIHLPYPYLFIDVNFTRPELEKLGIEINYEEIIGILVSEGKLYSEKDDKQVGTDLRISIVSKISKKYRDNHAVEDNCDIWFDTFNENINIEFPKYDGFNVEIKRMDTTDKVSRRLIYNFILAFINFVNNPEIKIIEVEYGKERNEKRIKKGKIPLPNSYIIELDGETKRYISDLEESGSFEHSYRFWVRGHFRTLRDRARYGDNVGKRIWILPFIKGKGVLIKKEYVLEKAKHL